MLLYLTPGFISLSSTLTYNGSYFVVRNLVVTSCLDFSTPPYIGSGRVRGAVFDTLICLCHSLPPLLLMVLVVLFEIYCLFAVSFVSPPQLVVILVAFVVLCLTRCSLSFSLFHPYFYWFSLCSWKSSVCLLLAFFLHPNL